MNTKAVPRREPPIPHEGVNFPPAWLWFVDELLPAYVKEHYSPRESWKGKPFSLEDARFFFKGIDELSDLFTEERPRSMPRYFDHPKFRSAYLLYFLPLQAAKFLMLFELHRAAIDAAIRHGLEKGVLRIADLGSGPGTASLAFLLRLLAERLPEGTELPRIELEWIDLNRHSLDDGKALAEALASQFPKLRGKVTVHTTSAPWWKAPELISGETSLIFLGHVLNESPGPHARREEERPAWMALWSSLLEGAHGGGILIVDPASRRSSQGLSQLRDALIESEIVAGEPTSIWGPCLHAKACPLAEGRDWCHFSFPAGIPGKWFKGFSKGLGSERQWLKFSYLWLAARTAPSPVPDPRVRRVISDPLGGPRSAEVLICEPERPGRYPVSPSKRIHRGDIIRVK